MPYRIPESRKIEAPVLDKKITSYVPLSDRKWYRSCKKAAELIDPSFEASRPKSTTHRYTKQLLIPQISSLVPQRLVKHDLNDNNKYRSVESILTDSTVRTKRNNVSDDDDLLLLPVKQYMEEINAREILKDEEVERQSIRTKKFKTGRELREELFGNEEVNLTPVKIPKKKQYMGTASEDLQKRHAKLMAPRKIIIQTEVSKD